MSSVSQDRRFGISTTVAVKAPCACATTANITLSGEQTIDGVTTSEDRVLVMNQTDATENGIYLSDSGAWTREPDFDGNRDVVKGTLVLVAGGSNYANSIFRVSTTNPIVIDSSDISFAASGVSDSANMNFTPYGTGALVSTAQAQMRRTVFIQNFAVGDGTTDDSAAITAMFTAYLGISVCFDGGFKTYKLGSTISKTLSANVTWQIKNANFTTASISEPVSETGAINITGDESITTSVWSGTNRISIENVTFTDSRTSAVAYLDGLMLHNFDQVWMANCRASGYSNTGLFMEVSRQVMVQNCDGSSNLYAGLRMANVYQCVVLGGTYNNNGKTIPTNGYGIALSAGDQTNSNINVLIQGVTANGNKRKAIDVHAGIHIHIVDNNISGVGYIGIYAQADGGGGGTGDITRDVLIRGNVIEADGTLTTGAAGIAVGSNGTPVSAVGQAIVSENIIKDFLTAGSWGIEVDAGSAAFALDTVLVIGNRVLTSGSSSSPSIEVRSTGAVLVGTVRVSHNSIYTAANNYGIRVIQTTNTIINANTIEITGGTVTCGIHYIDGTARNVMVMDNWLLGAATYTLKLLYGAAADSLISCQNNRYLTTQLKDTQTGQMSVDWGTAAPTTGDGYYLQGSIRWKTDVAAGGSPGWLCTTSGTAGSGAVFKAMAAVAA